MNRFEEIGIGTEIIKAITELGFESPTPIQDETIPHLLTSDLDLVALAQTGTGKTAAFSLPILQQLDHSSKTVQALILCPTRELCLQIARDIESFSKYNNVKTVAVYGGSSIETQIRGIRAGAQIIVGTPGRSLDLVKRKKLQLETIKWLVLDEADEMLSMGFKDDLDAILSTASEERQTLLFSATMPREIARIAKRYMKSPVEISAGERNQGAENVNHVYYMVQAKDRYPALKRIADMNPNIYGIVFCRTRMETKEVAEWLMRDGYNADALHGDLSQQQRDYVMNRFRIKNLQLLVATDVAARGLDVDDLTHIINYNLPDDLEVYIHRSGRTGRAGKSGTSIAIVHSREGRRVADLERKIKKTFERKPVPGGREICEKRLFNLIDKVEKVEVDEELIGEFIPPIIKKLEWLDREQLIKHFVSVEFNRYLSYYKNAPDLNITGRERSDGRDGGRKRDRKSRDGRDSRDFGSRSGKRIDFTPIYINIGEKNSLNPNKLVRFLNKHSPVKNVEIGQIDIMKKNSVFGIDSKKVKEFIDGFGMQNYNGVHISLRKWEMKKENAPKPVGKKKRKKKK